jgi:hypothetical protein
LLDKRYKFFSIIKIFDKRIQSALGNLNVDSNTVKLDLTSYHICCMLRLCIELKFICCYWNDMVSRSLIGKPVSLYIFMPSEAELTLLDTSICLHMSSHCGVWYVLWCWFLQTWGHVSGICGCLCLPDQCFCIEQFA